MTKLPVAAGLALALAAGSALAADLPRYKAPPPPPPPPPFTWTGLYGGINIGYGFGNGDAVVGRQVFRRAGAANAFQLIGPAWSLAHDLNGVTGGLQVGYNYQFNPWLVVGFEADIQAADIRAQPAGNFAFPAVAPFGPYSATTNTPHFVDWWGTARGRIGLTLPSAPNLMFYGTGGFAYGAVNSVFNYGIRLATPAAAFANSVYDDTRLGWAAGGGIEYSPLSFPTWSLKLEYLYTDLGSVTQNGFGLGRSVAAAGNPFTVAAVQNTPTAWHTVRAGVNWHFNPFYSAPVLAKY